MQPGQGVRFGPYCLVSRHGPFFYRSQSVTLPPKALAVLWHLVTHAGQVVSKDELLTAVWGDTVVSESVVAVCLGTLRQALREKARTPRYIETVHRIGYRFIGTVVSGGKQSDVRSPASEVPNPTPHTQHPAPALVGREAELVHLHNLFDKALNGERQLVFVTGEAGIGKTALVEAFVSGIGGQGVGVGAPVPAHLRHASSPPFPSPTPNPHPPTPGVVLGWGQCIEHYGTGEAYLPVLEALGRLCRQADGDLVLSVLRRVAPSWLLQLPSLLSEAERAALQQQVAGITRERMLREIVEALEALGAERLPVLVLEDVHWSDVSTIDLLNMLARRREVARVLVLATSRQAELVVANHPLKTLKQELVTRGQATEVLLGSLQAAAVQQYVRQRFAEREDDVELGALVYRRTEGHPLFMVQLTDYLEQRGTLKELNTTVAPASATAIPQQLRELIEVQVARLTVEEQRVLEAGSVAGAEFTIAGVAVALEQRVDEIETVCEQLTQRGQFIVECALSQWPDGTLSGRYGFRHALYQEIVYQRLSASRRVRLHQQIGLREEAAYGERANEIAAELAMHFERSQDAPRAVQYHTLAAQHAVRAHAHREALSHIARGLAFVSHIPDPALRRQRELVLQTLRGVSLVNTQGFAVPEVAEAYGRAHELSLKVADLTSLAPVLFGLWNFWLARADLGRASDLAQQLDALAQQQGDAALQGKAHTTAGQTCTVLGDFTAAFAHFRKGLAVYDESQHSLLVRQYGEDAAVSSYNVMGSVCWILGYPDQARQHLLAGRQLAQQLAYPFLRAQNLWRSVVVLQCCGALDEMAEYLTTLLRLCAAEAIPVWHASGLVLQGWTLVRQGQGATGMPLMHQGLQAWRAAGMEVFRPYYLALLAEAYGTQGQPEVGLHSLEEAVQLVASTGERWWEAELWRLKGELTLQGNQKSKGKRQKAKTSNTQPLAPSTQAEVEQEAEECFLKAIEVAQHQQAKSLELRAGMSLVRLRQQQGTAHATRGTHDASRGALADAHTMLAEVYGWFTEGFDTADLQEAKALLAGPGPNEL